MTAITLNRTLVARHAAGRADAYDAALLDVAQDHLLWLLAQLGQFDDGTGLIFKGGTSLRKCRLGGAGRFSTDLDFAAPADDTVLDVCETIHGASISGFSFELVATRGDGRHWALTIRHPELGRPAIGASVEFARRPLILPCDRLEFVPVPVHRSYEIELPALPVIAEAEACAEKLARYRRIALQRDLYDLSRFAQRAMDDPTVRRLWVLKVWQDVVEDRRGSGPLDPADILIPKTAKDFAPDSLGVLTHPVDIEGWERQVRRRFSFLANLNDAEKRLARCDPRDRREVDAAIAAGNFVAKH
jgi:predicted nucleotidyltransferase component of viral defense system